MRILLLLWSVTFGAFANIGTIMVLKGQATIQRDDILEAKMGMNISQGDRIITFDESRMQVILKDETVITIGANSSFDFREFLFDGSSNSKVNFKVNKGFFRTLTGKIGKIAPQRFKVKTISATIGVRGTDFGGVISKEEEIIHCYSGAIWVKFDKGGVENILSGMQLKVPKKPHGMKGVLPRPLMHKPMYRTQKLPSNLSDISTEIVKPKDLPSLPTKVEPIPTP